MKRSKPRQRQNMGVYHGRWRRLPSGGVVYLELVRWWPRWHKRPGKLVPLAALLVLLLLLLLLTIWCRDDAMRVVGLAYIHWREFQVFTLRRCNWFPTSPNVKRRFTTSKEERAAAVTERPYVVTRDMSRRINEFIIANKIGRKQILLWTTLYGTPWTHAVINRSMPTTDHCPVSNCRVTMDRAGYRHSDAILFHMFEDVNMFDLPKHREEKQRYVAAFIEPPTHVYWDLAWFNSYFNWTASYRLDSDVFLSYYDMQAVVDQSKVTNHAAASEARRRAKDRPIAWFNSHCRTMVRREDYVKRLRQYLPVDVYSHGRGYRKIANIQGGCGALECSAKNWGRDESCGEMLSRRYKFYVAFENALCRDYISERFYRALHSDVVPIVMGDGYEKMMPPGAYIDVRDFDTVRDLADYLITLDRNDTLYEQYFDWKRNLSQSIYHNPSQKFNWICDLCAKLNDPDEPVKTTVDLASWFNQCSNNEMWSLGSRV